MAVQLNHTIVAARDRDASAQFLADILGLPAPVHWGPFTIVADANGTSLDFMDWGDHEIATQHYAFLVSDDEFDAGFGRIRSLGLPYRADPHHETPNEINHNDGGRGVYFEDPNGHNLELLTVPYGGW
jgi:catechol 2,3-dioxygenase-like lactoylglutathione lyase family enzyme